MGRQAVAVRSSPTCILCLWRPYAGHRQAIRLDMPAIRLATGCRCHAEFRTAAGQCSATASRACSPSSSASSSTSSTHRVAHQATQRTRNIPVIISRAGSACGLPHCEWKGVTRAWTSCIARTTKRNMLSVSPARRLTGLQEMLYGPALRRDPRSYTVKTSF